MAYSNKKRAWRKTSKLKVGKCPHKRWSAEGVIIREVGRVNDDGMSMEEVHHRLCFLKTLQLINSYIFRNRMNDTILIICKGSYQSKGSAKLDKWGHKIRMRSSLEAISTTSCKPLHNVGEELEKKRIVRAKVILNRKLNLFYYIALKVALVAFIWSIGSNAVSCCIAGDGHLLKEKPPEEGLIMESMDRNVGSLSPVDTELLMNLNKKDLECSELREHLANKTNAGVKPIAVDMRRSTRIKTSRNFLLPSAVPIDRTMFRGS